jgi:hypothetical protein
MRAAGARTIRGAGAIVAGVAGQVIKSIRNREAPVTSRT